MLELSLLFVLLCNIVFIMLFSFFAARFFCTNNFDFMLLPLSLIALIIALVSYISGSSGEYLVKLFFVTFGLVSLIIGVVRLQTRLQYEVEATFKRTFFGFFSFATAILSYLAVCYPLFFSNADLDAILKAMWLILVFRIVYKVYKRVNPDY